MHRTTLISDSCVPFVKRQRIRKVGHGRRGLTPSFHLYNYIKWKPCEIKKNFVSSNSAAFANSPHLIVVCSLLLRLKTMVYKSGVNAFKDSAWYSLPKWAVVSLQTSSGEHKHQTLYSFIVVWYKNPHWCVIKFFSPRPKTIIRANTVIGPKYYSPFPIYKWIQHKEVITLLV